MRIYVCERKERKRSRRTIPKRVVELIPASPDSGEGVPFEPLNSVRKNGAQTPRSSQTINAFINMSGSLCVCVCVCVKF